MDHPAAKLILDLRSMHKMRDTFLGKHVLEHQINGRVYPSINQSKGEDGGTGTGRLSYTNPALQQIPSRNKELAAIIKPCFLPDEGQVWVDCDKASFEVRVFAHLVNNPEILAIYANDPEADFHQMVADLTGLVRNATYSGQANSKQLNLSMIFNSGNGAIAEKMGMSWSWDSFVPRGKQEKDRITYKKAGPRAMRVINEYHRRLPGIKELAEDQKNLALRNGYIETSVGRRLRFPRGYKAYKASGLLIQATAADINKENWVIIEDALGDYGRLLLNTHDSYGMSIDPEWEPHYKRVKKAIERDRLRVPLILDWNGTGHNWHDALQGKDLT
jgi:DNA polymerase I-like protein with 3'-5' exonuclease and polymerase domains